jgi:UDP-N-acetylmuramoyl-L-alanyl-D-glutamate--2,6-diaminopimelate ligase
MGFIACRGATPQSRDGHDFIATALDAGAPFVVVEDAARVPGTAKVPVLVADDTRKMAALLAERAAGRPSRQLSLIGVTGTNGKTTTTYLVAQMLEALGTQSAVFGTLGVGAPNKPKPLGFTTPEAEVTSNALRDLVDDEVQAVAMEVSSHALATKRVDGLTFQVAAWTNLTRDHLDFHGTMDAYRAAKERLFKELAPANVVVPTELASLAKSPITWGPGGRLQARDAKFDEGGIRCTLAFDGETAELTSPVLGAFNLENLLVAAGCGLALGRSLEAVARGLSRATAPPGRLQRVPNKRGQGPLVVVDYAHTPDALERALVVMREITKGALVVVFGCGGDRDPGKRALMGEAAGRLADMVVVTDDNPRTEDGDKIVDAIAAGVKGKTRVEPAELDRGTFTVLRDRRAAIAAAVAAARPGDTVLVAGKGHEKVQTVGTTNHPFDDVTEAAAALAEAR